MLPDSRTSANQWAVSKPEAALVFFLWKGAKDSLGVAGALAYFIRFGFSIGGRFIEPLTADRAEIEKVLEVLCQGKSNGKAVQVATLNSPPISVSAPVAEVKSKANLLNRITGISRRQFEKLWQKNLTPVDSNRERKSRMPQWWPGSRTMTILTRDLTREIR
jgi:hypothetical protein